MKNLKISLFSFFCLLLLITTSCVKEKITSPIEDFSIELPTISSINLNFPATVRIQQGPAQQIQITAQEEIFDALTKTVNNGVWNINLPGSWGYTSATINIILPQLVELKTTSTGDIKVADFFNNPAPLRLSSTSTGDIYFNGEAPTMIVEMEGTGDIELVGRTENLSVDIEGMGDLNAYDLQAEIATVIANDMGSAEVRVQRTLDATITDLGDIYYKGTPVIDSNISGSGKLVDAN